MGVFWLIAAVFLVAALAFVLPPLLRQRKHEVLAQKDLAISVYQDQFDELDNDLKNGVISEEQYGNAKSDIEKNLLEDIALIEAKTSKESADSQGGKVAAIVVGLVLPISVIGMYQYWGAGAAGLDPQNATPVVQAEEHNQQNVEEMADQLRARLSENPEDGEGWYMLARTYQFLRQYDDAVDAYAQAVNLGGDKIADVLAGYADAVAMASNRTLTAEAIGLLEQALAVDPLHSKSLWLAGTAAYQDRDYPKALKYWQTLRSTLADGSEEANQIDLNLNEIRSLMGQEPVASKPAVSSGSSEGVKGSVSLGGAVANKAQPEDTIFVFARPAEGPRMPLAIVRKQVKDLPFKFVLDDSQAMDPSMKISNFSRVMVGARISKSGNAMPQAGDLEGFSDVVLVGTDDVVNIVINTVVE